MRTYEVTIKATVTKTLLIQARDADKAIEQAHEMFTVEPETGVKEDYDEECLSCEEV